MLSISPRLLPLPRARSDKHEVFRKYSLNERKCQCKLSGSLEDEEEEMEDCPGREQRGTVTGKCCSPGSLEQRGSGNVLSSGDCSSQRRHQSLCWGYFWMTFLCPKRKPDSLCFIKHASLLLLFIWGSTAYLYSFTAQANAERSVIMGRSPLRFPVST